MAGGRVIPRSLDPLPDESLQGFLLRISHRLNLPIQHLVDITGLSTRRGQTTSYWLFELAPNQVHSFADATGLTPADVTAMTLVDLRDNYPPLRLQQRRFDPVKWLLASETWVFPQTSRYCPQCLAGDGSPIQQAHGGPWNRHWRLAVTFACTSHGRLLEHTCPACGLPAMMRHPSRSSGLVPMANSVGHPLQCRAAPIGGAFCPGRFDTTPTRTTPADKELLTLLQLQNKFDTLLHSDQAAPGRSLGQQVSSATYFTGLRYVATLLRACYPFSDNFTSERLNLIRDWFDYRRARGHRRQADSPAERYKRRDATGDHFYLPLDPSAAGSLLGLADEIISAEAGRWTTPLIALAHDAPVHRNVVDRSVIADSDHSPLIRRLHAIVTQAAHEGISLPSNEAIISQLKLG